VSDPEYVGDKDVNKDVVAETLLQGVLDSEVLTLADGEWVTERDIAGDLLADPDLVEETQGERVALLLEQEEEEGERDTVIDVEIV